MVFVSMTAIVLSSLLIIAVILTDIITLNSKP